MVDQGYICDFHFNIKADHSTSKHTYDKDLICKFLNSAVQQTRIKSFNINEGKNFDIINITIQNTQSKCIIEQFLRIFPRTYIM